MYFFIRCQHTSYICRLHVWLCELGGLSVMEQTSAFFMAIQSSVTKYLKSNQFQYWRNNTINYEKYIDVRDFDLIRRAGLPYHDCVVSHLEVPRLFWISGVEKKQWHKTLHCDEHDIATVPCLWLLCLVSSCQRSAVAPALVLGLPWILIWGKLAGWLDRTAPFLLAI